MPGPDGGRPPSSRSVTERYSVWLTETSWSLQPTSDVAPVPERHTGTGATAKR